MLAYMILRSVTLPPITHSSIISINHPHPRSLSRALANIFDNILAAIIARSARAQLAAQALLPSTLAQPSIKR